MRSMRIVAPRTLALEEVPVPSFGTREVRFRVQGCGIALSSAWLGTGSHSYPCAPGESPAEAWGVVDAVGAEVTSVRPGDRVAVLSGHAYAEYDIAQESHVVRLPKVLDDSPFPSASVGGAMTVVERAGLTSHQTVAVVGVGFLGALLVKLASGSGARVIAVSRRPFSLTVGREMGATNVVAIDGVSQVTQEVDELTSSRGCDVVFEATGTDAGLDLAFRLVGRGGSIVLAGHHAGKPQLDLGFWCQRGFNVLSGHETSLAGRAGGVRSAVDALQTGRLSLRRLVTHEFELAALGEAFQELERRPFGWVKAVAKVADGNGRHP